MARRKNPPTEFTELWDDARGQIDRKALSQSLDISQGRLNDLILGRSRPTLGETSKLNDRRRASRVYYEQDDGQVRSFYTGRGTSLRQVLRHNQIHNIIDEMGEGSVPKGGYGRVLAVKAGGPVEGSRARVYSLSPTLRQQVRR